MNNARKRVCRGTFPDVFNNDASSEANSSAETVSTSDMQQFERADRTKNEMREESVLSGGK